MALTKAPANFKTEKPLYKPYISTKQGKKGMVFVKSTSGGKRLIHFGDTNYKHNYSKEARASYCARSGGIRNKAGKLPDKNSPNWWSRKVLWKC